MAVVLIIIGIFLIVFNVRSIKKNNSPFQKVLNTTKNDIPEYKVEIGKLREEISDTILELQEEIEEIKANKSVIDVKSGAKKSDSKEIKENNIENSVNLREIERLLKSGLSVDEVAKKLNVGKGEVILIRDLYLS